MKTGSIACWALVGFVGLAGLVGCATGNGPDDDGPLGASSSVGGSPGEGAGDTGASGPGQGGGFVETGGAPPNGCPNTCSADLHDVLDCQGNVVSTCPPELACGAEGCVEPCEAAQQNQSTIGCDYYVVAPDVIPEGAGGCFAAFVTNTWDLPVSISLEFAGQSFDAATHARIPSGSGQALTYAPLPEGKIPPGEVAIVFLSRFGTEANDCPAGITPALTTEDPATHGTGYGKSFRLQTSAPVVAYDIYPYGGGISAATSATLLLPTSAWGDNYVAVTAFRKSQVVATGDPFVEIVASEDNTTVTLSPTVAIVGGLGIGPSPVGVPQTYTLGRGQVLQLTQPAELVGTPIQADKPIGVWGGASCLNIDVAAVACDAAHQQIPPVVALGSEYVAGRYRNRFDGVEESPPWRIVGAVDGTQLSYEPAAPAGAPLSISSGEVAEFRASGSFVVRSQDDDHPFYVSGHMTGCQEVNPALTDCRGDPEFVGVVPSAQYLDSYVFFTDPTYPETNLVLVRKKKDGAFFDVTLDCYGVVDTWEPIGDGQTYELARIDLVRGNFEKQGQCDNGRHTITSEAPFGLTVWGWGSIATGGDFTGLLPGLYSQAVSYAYPSGASVKPINTVEVPPVPR